MILKNKQILLFQGDSITDSDRLNTFRWIRSRICLHSIVSWLKAKYYKYQFEFFNRGVSGNTILDLKDRWQKDCLSLKPNVISILIEINDYNENHLTINI